MFKTRVCDVLGIEYPILQSPMNWVTTPELIAAVCNAGGLGILDGNVRSRQRTFVSRFERPESLPINPLV